MGTSHGRGGQSPPKIVTPNWDNFPQELRDLPRWVLWAFEKKSVDSVKWDKIPKRPDGQKNASHSAPNTWSPFTVVREAKTEKRGVGFVFNDDGILGVDLDDAVHVNGVRTIKPWAQEIIDKFKGTYMEWSPSGKGLHILCRGSLTQTDGALAVHDSGGVVVGKIERYASTRFFTMTGDVFDPGDGVVELQNAVDWLEAKYPRRQKTKTAGSTQIAPATSGSFGPKWQEDMHIALRQLEARLAKTGGVHKTHSEWLPFVEAAVVGLGDGEKTQRLLLDISPTFRIANTSYSEEKTVAQMEGTVRRIARGEGNIAGPHRLKELFKDHLDLYPSELDTDEVFDDLDLDDGLEEGLGEPKKKETPKRPDWIARFKNRKARNLKAEPAPVEWAVEGWIQQGKVGCLIATGNTGKTTLLIYLAICIATGRPFFGNAVRKGTFVIFSADDDKDDLDAVLTLMVRQSDLTDAEIELVDRCVVLESLIGEPTRTFTQKAAGVVVPTHNEKLFVEALRDIPDLVGVALDTFRQFSGGTSVDEEIGILTIAAGGYISANLPTHPCVVFPHHSSKASEREKAVDAFVSLGTTAITDNSRFALLLRKITWIELKKDMHITSPAVGDPLALIATRGSLRVRKPDPIYIVRNGYGLTRIECAPLDFKEKLVAEEKTLLEIVRDWPGDKKPTATDLYRKIGGQKQNFLKRLKLLSDASLIDGYGQKQRSSGRISLTLIGEKALSGETDAEPDAEPDENQADDGFGEDYYGL